MNDKLLKLYGLSENDAYKLVSDVQNMYEDIARFSIKSDKLLSNSYWSNDVVTLVLKWAILLFSSNTHFIFSFDSDSSKLCYGSIHLKKDSLVVFNVKPNIKKYIDDNFHFLIFLLNLLLS